MFETKQLHTLQHFPFESLNYVLQEVRYKKDVLQSIFANLSTLVIFYKNLVYKKLEPQIEENLRIS